jgi:hypothetical protein
VRRILEGRLRGLRQENEQLRLQGEQRRARAVDSLRRLPGEAAALTALYPDFDWRRELRNPAFGQLITAGVDVRTAYEVAHREEILCRAMAYAARRAREQAARAAAYERRRVAESGGTSPHVSRSDPRQLTGAELADIRRRVFDGEKIRF